MPGLLFVGAIHESPRNASKSADKNRYIPLFAGSRSWMRLGATPVSRGRHPVGCGRSPSGAAVVRAIRESPLRRACHGWRGMAHTQWNNLVLGVERGCRRQGALWKPFGVK